MRVVYACRWPYPGLGRCRGRAQACDHRLWGMTGQHRCISGPARRHAGRDTLTGRVLLGTCNPSRQRPDRESTDLFQLLGDALPLHHRAAADRARLRHLLADGRDRPCSRCILKGQAAQRCHRTARRERSGVSVRQPRRCDRPALAGVHSGNRCGTQAHPPVLTTNAHSC